MALQRITLRPGVNKQATPTLNEGGISDANRVRFRDGWPQPIGGWGKQISSTLTGACRKLHGWVTLASVKLLAAGTSSGLYLAQDGSIYDVTPLRLTLTLANPFTVTAKSGVVQVTHLGHSATVGDGVFIGPASIAGLVLNGLYRVASVIDANTYTVIQPAGVASATATGGGSVQVAYQIASGPVDVPYLNGFGVGPFGADTFGTARSTTVPGTLRLWSLDHWGEELVACPRGGGIYRWRPADGITTRAAAIDGAPATALGIMVGMPERHLIAFGTNGNPLEVRWSDVENYNVWTATATNSAGEFPLVGGSEIRSWAAAMGEILVWTDASLWAMRFQGLPTVYGFYLQGTSCGTIAPNAAVVLDGAAYWMSTRGFFRYAGQVQPIQCDVWDAIFRNLNTQQQAKIHGAANVGWNEITWYYPSSGSVEIDSYVTLDVVNGHWTLGLLDRLAWIDAGVFANPLAVNLAGQVYAHEFGTTADGADLDWYFQSGYFDIGDGTAISFVDEVIPDFADFAGSIDVTLKAQNFPGGGEVVKGPFSIVNTTRHISPRIRGRQLALRVESGGVGSFGRLGAIRTKLAQDGRK